MTPVVTQVLTSAILPLLPMTLNSCGAARKGKNNAGQSERDHGISDAIQQPDL